MANQKGGLHKQVGAIFDGVPNPNGEQPDDAQQNDSGSNSSPAQPQKVFRPDSLGSVPERISPKQRQERSSQPQPQPEIIQPPQHITQPEPEKKQRSVMLPASLTIKPDGMSLIDTLKIKLNEALEKHGQRQVVMTLVIPILAIILVFFMYKNLFPSKPKKVSIEPEVKTNVSASFNTGKVEFSWQKPQAYPVDKLRDPMKTYRSPGRESQIQPGDLIVNGILYDSDDPASSKAVINSQQVRIGDNVGSAKITDIQEEYVEFESGQKVWTQSVGY